MWLEYFLREVQEFRNVSPDESERDDECPAGDDDRGRPDLRSSR